MTEDNRKIDRRVWNGGARKGAGRPSRTLPKVVDDFLDGTVVVKEQQISYRNGKPYRQVRRVKKTRYEAMLDSYFKYAPFAKGNKRITNLLLRLGSTPEWQSPKEKKIPKVDPQLRALKRDVRAWKKREKEYKKAREAAEVAQEAVAEQEQQRQSKLEKTLERLRQEEEDSKPDYMQWNGRRILSGQRGRIIRR